MSRAPGNSGRRQRLQSICGGLGRGASRSRRRRPPSVAADAAPAPGFCRYSPGSAGRPDRPPAGIRSRARHDRRVRRHGHDKPGKAARPPASPPSPDVRNRAGVARRSHSQQRGRRAQRHHRRERGARGLGTLGEPERVLVGALYRSGTAHRLAETGFGSRSDLYRRTREIRFSLVAAGLGRIANAVGRGVV
jgi:hypothetical protein